MEVELSHVVGELVLLGDQVLALGLREREGCQDDGEPQPDPDGRAAFECPEPGVLGLSLFDLGQAPDCVWSQLFGE